MDTLILPFTVVRCDAEGPPRRQLKLTCTIKNPAPTPLCFIQAWVIVEVLNGLKIAEGNLFHMEYALAYSPVIAHDAVGTGIVTIELPSEVLHTLEQRRAGGDLPIRISTRVLVCEAPSESKSGILGRPIQTLFQAGQSGEVQYMIPQSEWVKLLRSMAWSEIELLELPSRDLRSDVRFHRALKRLEEAQDCYRRGMWEDVVTNCRKLFEAVIKDVGGEDTMEHSQMVIQTLVSDPPKAERINELILSLSKFLHLARHEQLPAVAIGPTEAMLALHMSVALLTYLVRP